MEKIIIIIGTIIFQLLLIYAVQRWSKKQGNEEKEETVQQNPADVEDETIAAEDCKESKEDELLIKGLEEESSLKEEEKKEIGKDEESELLSDIGNIEASEEEKDVFTEFSTDQKAEELLGELEDFANKLKNKASR